MKTVKLYGTETKKMLNILILEILRNYSDAEHHLTQQEIIRKLKSEYEVEKIDRRSVKANVKSLRNMGYDIGGIGEEDADGAAGDDIKTDGYFLRSREFEDEELRILIDSVLFSKTLSNSAAKRLIEKLKDLGNIYFDAKVSHVKQTSILHRTDNKSVLYSVSAINEAIDKKSKIRFRYNHYGTDLKMHDTGKDFIMNPYQMVASNGQYYLLGNIDKYDNVSYFRIDKMSNVEIVAEKIKPQKEVKGLDGHLDLPKHMAEHIYMLCGDSVPARIKTNAGMMDSLVDWFGKDFKIIETKGDEITISVKCNEQALFYWSLQYGPYVEVVAPKKLRLQIAEAICEMSKKYERDI